MVETSPSPQVPPLAKRVLLKLSGELFLHEDRLAHVLDQLTQLHTAYAFIIVTGGGNILRGQTSRFQEAPRALSDDIGMTASVLNALMLKARLCAHKVDAMVISPFSIPGATSLFDQTRALSALAQKKILIVGGGLGQPYLTTDTTGVLTALKLGCPLMLKGTKVDGVFTKDPMKDPHARLLPETSYDTLIQNKLQVLDSTSVVLARDNKLTMRIFNMMKPNSLRHVLEGVPPFTHIAG